MRSSKDVGNARAVAAALSIGLLAGCATPGAHRAADPLAPVGAPQSIAIVVAPADGQGVDPDVLAQVGKNAAMDALVGAMWAAVFAGPYGVAIVGPMLAAGAIGGATGGLAYGAPYGLTEAQEDELHRSAAVEALRSSLAASTAQAVADEAASTGVGAAVVALPAFSSTDADALGALRAQGYGAVVHLRRLDLRFVPAPGWRSELVLTLAAEATLVDSSDGRLVAMRGLLVESEPAPVEQWTHDDAARARAEVRRAGRTLAERAVETFLLHTALSVGDEGLRTAHMCGVVPTQPAPLSGWAGHPRAVRVESRAPMLVWSEPTALRDVHAPPPAARDFRYDVRVWKLVEGAQRELAYERTGLREPRHRVETPLEAATTYGWSVRARYTVDGRPRAVRWSASQSPEYRIAPANTGRAWYAVADEGVLQPRACSRVEMTPCGCLDFIPTANLWRFATP